MSIDATSYLHPGMTHPAKQAAAVTPHDTNNLSPPARSLYVGGGGNVVAILVGDTASVTFSNVPDGTILPISVSRVLSTSTTATSILALY